MKQASIKIHPLPSDHKETSPKDQEIGQLSLDIYKDKGGGGITIKAPIAGVEKNDVILSVTDDVLIIKGSREEAQEVQEDDYYTKECFWGSFSRSIVLPLNADTKKISASFEKNVLEIHIPLTEGKEQTKIIKIKSD
jgi:HSP20 family protein